MIPKFQSAGLATVEEHHALSSPVRYSITDFETGSIRNEALNTEVCEHVYKTLAFNLSTHGAAPPPF
jgi:hypothetical protein